MKLEFTLRQHTPMIHFQSDQAGATLRATELKPKLDRYLIEKTFHNNYEECKQYLVGYTNKNENALRKKYEEEGFRALDYKFISKLLKDSQRMIFNGVEEIERPKHENNGSIKYKINRRTRQIDVDDYGDPIHCGFLIPLSLEIWCQRENENNSRSIEM